MKEDLIWLMWPGAPEEPTTLAHLLARPAWHDRAACRGQGHDGFIIEARRTPSGAVVAVCRRCPVREECLAFALADDSLQGI